MSKVTLLAPGCFSPGVQPIADEPFSDQNTVAAGATVSPAPTNNHAEVLVTDTKSVEQSLFSVFGLPPPSLGAIPAAALYTSTEGNPSVCAVPVHLQADKDNARLVPPEALAIEEAESAMLVQAFNNLVNDDGLVLTAHNALHWILTGQAAESLDTWPYHTVANGRVAAFLPRDPANAAWRTLMTESQMLFHAHPVNEKRLKLGKLPINAIWFWGGATWPSAVANEHTALYASDDFTRLFAQKLGFECKDLQEAQNVITALQTVEPLKNNNSVTAFDDPTAIVIVDMSIYKAWLSADANADAAARAALIQHWIEPLQQAVAEEKIKKFVLDGCEGQALLETSAQATVSSNKSTVLQRLNKLLRRRGYK